MSNQQNLPVITEEEWEYYCGSHAEVTGETMEWLNQKGLELNNGDVRVVLKKTDGSSAEVFMCTDIGDFGTLGPVEKTTENKTTRETKERLPKQIERPTLIEILHNGSERRSQEALKKYGVRRPIVEFGPWQKGNGKK